MASIKGIAKKIVKNFKNAGSFTEGVGDTVKQATEATKKVTQKATKKATETVSEASEKVSDGVFSKKNIEKLKDEKDKAKAVHNKNVETNDTIKQRIKDDISNLEVDPDMIDEAIKNGGDKKAINEVVSKREKEIRKKHSLSEEEIGQQFVDDMKYYGASAKYYGAQIGSKTKSGAEWIGKNAFDVTEDAEKFFGYDVKLSGKAKMLAAGGVGLYGAYNFIGSSMDTDYGEIEGGISVGTINETYSKEFNKMVDYANGSPKGMEEFSKTTMSGTLGSKISGVDPEIVFALHQLRNGG